MQLRVAVVVAKRMSNFTDFDPFLGEPGVTLDFVRPGQRLGRADIVILPGSKNTIDDMVTLREAGLADEVLDNHRAGATIVGVCGGFQMLGRKLSDPHGVEGNRPEVEGLGLLDAATVMETEKVTAQAEGRSYHHNQRQPPNTPGLCVRPHLVFTRRTLRLSRFSRRHTYSMRLHPPLHQTVRRRVTGRYIFSGRGSPYS